MDFEAAKRYALDKLENDLSSVLYYHSAAHTRDDVVPAVIWLSQQEKIRGEDYVLLCTAAWYHDLGYITGIDDHETKSKQLVSQVLPSFGYSSDHISIIHGLIEATRIPQLPKSLIEEIMADADLDTLGRVDFFDTSHLLYIEMLSLGNTITPLEWIERQLSFLQSHTYFTTTAKTERDPIKQENIAALIMLLEQMQE